MELSGPATRPRRRAASSGNEGKKEREELQKVHGMFKRNVNKFLLSPFSTEPTNVLMKDLQRH